jgi:hypothetical protein
MVFNNWDEIIEAIVDTIEKVDRFEEDKNARRKKTSRGIISESSKNLTN